MKRSVVAAALAFFGALVALPSVASAQQYLPAASAYGATGIEGAGSGFQRARTRIKLALELRMDESPEDALVGGLIVDVEPRAAFGADIRYLHALSPSLAISGGAIGYFVPALLFGPCAGVEVRVPVEKKLSLALGPELAVFALGSDLPDRTVIWQALFQLGFRADL